MTINNLPSTQDTSRTSQELERITQDKNEDIIILKQIINSIEKFEQLDPATFDGYFTILREIGEKANSVKFNDDRAGNKEYIRNKYGTVDRTVNDDSRSRPNALNLVQLAAFKHLDENNILMNEEILNALKKDLAIVKSKIKIIISAEESQENIVSTPAVKKVQEYGEETNMSNFVIYHYGKILIDKIHKELNDKELVKELENLDFEQRHDRYYIGRILCEIGELGKDFKDLSDIKRDFLFSFFKRIRDERLGHSKENIHKNVFANDLTEEEKGALIYLKDTLLLGKFKDAISNIKEIFEGEFSLEKSFNIIFPVVRKKSKTSLEQELNNVLKVIFQGGDKYNDKILNNIGTKVEINNKLERVMVSATKNNQRSGSNKIKNFKAPSLETKRRIIQEKFDMILEELNYMRKVFSSDSEISHHKRIKVASFICTKVGQFLKDIRKEREEFFSDVTTEGHKKSTANIMGSRNGLMHNVIDSELINIKDIIFKDLAPLETEIENLANYLEHKDKEEYESEIIVGKALTFLGKSQEAIERFNKIEQSNLEMWQKLNVRANKMNAIFHIMQEENSEGNQKALMEKYGQEIHEFEKDIKCLEQDRESKLYPYLYVFYSIMGNLVSPAYNIQNYPKQLKEAVDYSEKALVNFSKFPGDHPRQELLKCLYLLNLGAAYIRKSISDDLSKKDEWLEYALLGLYFLYEAKNQYENSSLPEIYALYSVIVSRYLNTIHLLNNKPYIILAVDEYNKLKKYVEDMPAREDCIYRLEHLALKKSVEENQIEYEKIPDELKEEIGLIRANFQLEQLKCLIKKYEELGIKEDLSGRLKTAKDSYDKEVNQILIRKINPKRDLAARRVYEGKYKEAVEIYEEAMKITDMLPVMKPYICPTLLEEMGDAYLCDSKQTEALDCFERSLQSHITSIPAKNSKEQVLIWTSAKRALSIILKIAKLKINLSGEEIKQYILEKYKILANMFSTDEPQLKQIKNILRKHMYSNNEDKELIKNDIECNVQLNHTKTIVKKQLIRTLGESYKNYDATEFDSLDLKIPYLDADEIKGCLNDLLVKGGGEQHIKVESLGDSKFRISLMSDEAKECMNYIAKKSICR